MSSNLQDPLKPVKNATVDVISKWTDPEERTGAKRLPEVSILMLPLLAILFWSTPWEGDPRTAPMVKRLFQLKASPWSWDQAEYRSMLESVDPNELVDGVPVFVRLGIEGYDQELLQKLIVRGADLNSSEWGCSPLLAALEADDKALKREPNEYDRKERVQPKFTKLLLRAGADPNQSPTMDSINRRIATRFPSGVCEQLDSRLKAGERVLLIAINTSSDEELLQLLVEKGIAPRDKQEAENVMSSLRVGKSRAAQTLHDRCLKAGASIDSAGSALVDVIGGAQTEAERLTAVVALLKKGADPNAKGDWKGQLPLEKAIDACSQVEDRFLWSRDIFSGEHEYMSNYYAEQWRTSNAKARRKNVGTRDLITLLLDSGADPNRRRPADGDGTSILAQAVRGCPSDIPELLVSKGAVVDKEAVNAAYYDLKRFLQSRLPAEVR